MGVSGGLRGMVMVMVMGKNLRLQKFVASLKLLVFILDNFYTVDDFHEAGLEGFGLPGKSG